MPTDNKSEIVIFKTANKKISVDVRFEGETIWLTAMKNIPVLIPGDKVLSSFQSFCNSIFTEQ